MAKKEKQTKSLEQTIWESCNKLRSNMTSINYMHFVLGLVFLKFASLKFEARRNELLSSDDKAFVDMPSFYKEKNVFFLSEPSRWSTIKANAKQSDIGIRVDNAFEEIEKTNPELRGATPIGIYSKTSLPAEKFASLITEIDKIEPDQDHPMSDLIGRVYQYFLNKFAIKSADEKGEFYTPDTIVDLIVELIQPYSGKIYDPCCGSGGMFIQSYKFVESHRGNAQNISVYGQESNPDTWKLAKMNLAIRGIPCNLGKKEADTFGDDQHKDEHFDFIIANPPFNLKNWRGDNALLDDARWHGYGVPPVSNANYAWILHMLSKLTPNTGVAGFLLANGALGADGEEKAIRENLIKNHKIEAIVVLPREMFYYTDISVTLWIMDENKGGRIVEHDGQSVQLRDRTNDVLFMDLRQLGHYSSDGFKELNDKDKDENGNPQINEVKLVKETLFNWQSPEWKTKYKDVPEFCKSVTESVIGDKEHDYSLVPSKYIEFIDHDLQIDFPKEMEKIQREMKDIIKEEKQSQSSLEDAFKRIGYGID
jgi:type I restriction enzyme M protein